MKIWYFLKEWNSEIPCLVIELPASGATPMKNPAYNGGARLLKGRVIPWEVVSLGLIDPVTTYAPPASGA